MSWYNSSWKYRVKITVDKDKVGSTLTDFPVYVDLSTLPSGFHSNVKNDGGDIRVTRSDGTTECPREVVFYDATNDEGELHFKANSLSSTSDTDFYIYYGNANASDYATDATYGAENVWTNGYGGVHHFEETSGTLYDSTSNSKDITAGGSPTYAANAQIGKGINYTSEGVDNKLYTASAFDTQANDWTFEFWANYTQIADYQTLIWYQADTSGNWRELLTVDNTSNIKVWWQGGPAGSDTTVDMVWGAFHHWVFAYDDTNLKLYIYKDGILQNSGGFSSDLGNAGSQAKWAHFNRWDATTQGGQGTLDEWRFSSVLRSSTWVSTEYNNQSSPSTFYSVGSQEVKADSERGLYIEGSSAGTSANSERGLYIGGKDAGNSERSLYTSGSQTLSTDYFKVSYSVSSERGLYILGYSVGTSYRGLYIQGQSTGSSERGLYIEGKTVESGTSERGLYIEGFDVGSSERNLYTHGYSTGSSDRGLYLKGYIFESSERNLYAQGSLEVSGERGLYLIGKSLEGERELYIWGSEIDNSERGLFIEGAYLGYGSRELYIHGYLSNSSVKGLYLSGYDTETSERVFHLAGFDLGASERGILTWGKDTDTSSRGLYIHGRLEDGSERGLYIQGSLEDGSNRKLYLEGYISANIERTLYIQGQETLNSSMPLYIWGYEVGSFERNLYIQGYDIKSSSRGLYIQGYLSDNSDRELYLFGYDIETSERGLYLVGLDLGTSERSIYLESKDMGASERDLYVHGFVRSFSNRGLYIVGDGEVPFHEGNVIIKIDEGLYLNPKTGRIYVAIE